MHRLTHLSASTRAALVTLAQGPCQFPGCRTPVLVFLGDGPELNVEVVRIRGADPDGPRYVRGFGEQQRDRFENLLLLCVPHRRTVDRDEAAHPVELLETWRTRLDDDLGALAEPQLAELLSTVLRTVKEQVDEALAGFEKTDAEAARLLRDVLTGLHREHSRYGADPRLAATLTRVTRRLDALDSAAPPAVPRPPRVNVGWATPTR